ncbi:MAG: bifunctional ornithine acetyltransferase/N-acetylglutamate synthase [Deltaproteobacteria bacterium]|jgi:glutamate N-acetyltransferase/amino-acid N-acetyltransferase|nr:bifunctional ornithine acetyltransferase/N-acetylglutamate synthase [Deltaproteobacteria bacterium]
MKIRRMSRPVAGFRAGGINVGIKAAASDLALIAADVPANAAAVFTTSTVVGAPVEVSREHVARGKARGIIVNSGISNVAMGARGLRDARAMAALTARELDCAPEEILVASTGVIGEPLPMGVLRAGIPRVAESLSSAGWGRAAEAIRTTDTFAKVASTRFRLGGRYVTIQGIAKGSGMIEPNMATMLSFIATDAAISPGLLRKMLGRVADSTYNRLSVDGEGSTSDTVVLMASGRAAGGALRAGSRLARQFEAALGAVCEDLVRQLARDGEGATKLLVVEVRGARTSAEADRAVRRIGNSLLVKTALFGGDPNWGRILQTLGAGQIAWNPDKTRVQVGGVVVFSRGRSAGSAARKRAEKALQAEEIAIQVDLARGKASARLFSCDLTYDYVRINAEYTT